MPGIHSKKMRLFICFSLCGFLLLFGAAHAAAEKSGTVSGASGQVIVQAVGAAKWKPARVGLDIRTGDTIRTGKDSWIEITMVDGSVITLGGGSQLKINEYAYNPEKKIRVSKVRLFLGKVRCLVNDVFGYKRKAFEVTTKTVVAGARGTEFMVWLDDDQTTKAAAFKNDIRVAPVSAPNAGTTVREGHFILLEQGGKAGEPQKITDRQLDRFNQGMPGPRDGKPGTGPAPPNPPDEKKKSPSQPSAPNAPADTRDAPGSGNRGGGGGRGGGSRP